MFFVHQLTGPPGKSGNWPPESPGSPPLQHLLIRLQLESWPPDEVSGIESSQVNPESLIHKTNWGTMYTSGGSSMPFLSEIKNFQMLTHSSVSAKKKYISPPKQNLSWSAGRAKFRICLWSFRNSLLLMPLMPQLSLVDAAVTVAVVACGAEKFKEEPARQASKASGLKTTRNQEKNRTCRLWDKSELKNNLEILIRNIKCQSMLFQIRCLKCYANSNTNHALNPGFHLTFSPWLALLSLYIACLGVHALHSVPANNSSNCE